MFSSSRFKSTSAFSLLLPILIIGLTLFGSTRLVTHASVKPLNGLTKSRNQPTASILNCGTWSVISSPSPGTGGNYLTGLAANSVKDFWAVGYSINNGFSQSLIEHWDGTQWSVVPSPDPGSNGVFEAVSQVPGTDQAWAVGTYEGNSSNQTLIERWDGTSWHVVSSPNPGLQENVLFGVAAVSATNVWAVGNYYNTGNGPTLSLIEHWNGNSWHVVSSPNPGGQYNYLQGLTAISAHNIWAVGVQVSNTLRQTLTEHWNGSKWSVVSDPNVGGSSNLQGVARVPGTNQAWAVGTYEGNSSNQTLIEHWNGTNWSVVSSPNVGSYENNLNGVVAVSVNNVWAVGDVYNSNDNYNHETLTEHWNGTSWSVVPSPNPGTPNILSGVTRVPGTNQIWAVGYEYDSSGIPQTLTEFYC